MTYHEAVIWALTKHPGHVVECDRFESLGKSLWRITVYENNSRTRLAEYILEATGVSILDGAGRAVDRGAL